MARTYSALLLYGNLGAGTTTLSLSRIVPAGHTWVMRTVTASPQSGQANILNWAVTVAGAQIPGGFAITVVAAAGTSSKDRIPSEWEGTIVVPAGYTLAFVANPFEGQTAASTFLVSGYDLVD